MKTLLLIYLVVLAQSDPQSSTFRLITGEEERTLDLRLDNLDLITIAARTGECINITVEKASQTAVVEHGVRVIMDCSQLLRGPDTSMTWHQLNLEQYNATPSGVPLFELVTSSYNIVAGDRGSALIIPSTNVVEGSTSHGTVRYTCMAHTNGAIRLRNTTIFVIGSEPHLGTGGCYRQEASNSIVCDVGLNYTTPEVFPKDGIDFLLLQCPVLNINGHPSLGPAYPRPAYTWKKDNVTVIKNGRLTEDFYELYPEIMMLNPPPITIHSKSSFEVSFSVSNASGINEAPVNCSNHFVYAEWKDYILYTMVGTWQCEVVNIYGEDTGELIIMEKDQCTEDNTVQCGEGIQCLTVAGQFCCNCPLEGYTHDMSGINCTAMEDMTTEKIPEEMSCLDVLMSQNITSSIGITVESADNYTFIAQINCTDNQQSLGSLNCTVNESGIAVVEGSLQCVPPADSGCSTICLVLAIVVGIFFFLLILILLVILIVCCLVRVRWKHRFFPSKTKSNTLPKRDMEMMPTEKYNE